MQKNIVALSLLTFILLSMGMFAQPGFTAVDDEQAIQAETGAFNLHQVTHTIDYNFSDPSIAVDNQGLYHITYAGDFSTKHQIIHSIYNLEGPSIVNRMIVTDFDEKQPSMALDNYDGIHLAYVRDGGGATADIVYAQWAGTAWISTTVTSNTYIESVPSIAVDSSGNAHIVFERQLSSGLDTSD